MGSIDDLFLLSLNVVGVAGRSSSNRVRRDSVGQAAVGAQAGGIAGGPEGVRAVGAAVCARAGVIHHLGVLWVQLGRSTDPDQYM